MDKNRQDQANEKQKRSAGQDPQRERNQPNRQQPNREQPNREQPNREQPNRDLPHRDDSDEQRRDHRDLE